MLLCRQILYRVPANKKYLPEQKTGDYYALLPIRKRHIPHRKEIKDGRIYFIQHVHKCNGQRKTDRTGNVYQHHERTPRTRRILYMAAVQKTVKSGLCIHRPLYLTPFRMTPDTVTCPEPVKQSCVDATGTPLRLRSYGRNRRRAAQQDGCP